MLMKLIPEKKSKIYCQHTFSTCTILNLAQVSRATLPIGTNIERTNNVQSLIRTNKVLSEGL